MTCYLSWVYDTEEGVEIWTTKVIECLPDDSELPVAAPIGIDG